ncbi:MAG: lanthionine synthetase LanC family protein [Bacteroidia bacterium]
MVNLTFAHGLPSVIANVFTAFQRGIQPEQSRRILESGIDFIMQTRLDPTIYGSYFGFILDKEKETRGSRIAWCQGDLVMGQFLFRVGKALDNEELAGFAREVLLHTSRRQSHVQSLVVDCSFCHGTAGAMHMFARAWHLSPEPEFKDAVRFWYEENLKQARYIDGRLEFHPLRGGENTAYFKDDSLTMGSAGVGLCLLAAATGLAPAWDEAFHLSLS